ncbi:c-type cytochrome [Ideonella sp. A 288]|uniref:c-type cytochrome n=1 Tax=Ideonella sp. A 288 TaxID=1962181 RepID=UPI000B4B78E6|nr:c-type cytochrome [Ideonella sp. A 288]
MSRLRQALATLVALAVAALAFVAWAPVPAVDDREAAAPLAPDAAQAARGAQLALAGNCAGCHTERGGAPYAGGRGIETPFGTVVAGNLTPDPATGLGRWTAGEFRRALQHGVSRDGRLLVPAFPYTSFTQVTRDDADALWAHLRSLPPVQQAKRPHALRWPYGSDLALRVWRALYFRPGTTPADPAQSAEWNRGAYLVRGLGHCEACHARRDALGGIRGAAALQGGRLPQGWYAPSLTDATEAGVADWPIDEVVRLLRTGLSEHGTAQGPMAEVVVRSTQHLAEADLRAVAVYLRSLPVTTSRPGRSGARDPQVMARGQALYADLCRGCHGDEGQGAPGVYPALAGSRMVTMADTTNLLRVITQGGFAPATAANPRPYGMPPFDLGHADLAALMTWLRATWGHDASPVSEVQVLTAR